MDELPDYGKLVFPSLKPQPLSSVLPGASPGALDLLSKFLVYDPTKRIRAAEVSHFRPPSLVRLSGTFANKRCLR